MSLQEDMQRLKKANEHIIFCKQAETKAIKDLVEARQQLSRSREKYEELFHECEARAVKRLLSHK